MYLLKRSALMSNRADVLGTIISPDSWEDCYLDFIHADMNKIKRSDVVPDRDIPLLRCDDIEGYEGRLMMKSAELRSSVHQTVYHYWLEKIPTITAVDMMYEVGHLDYDGDSYLTWYGQGEIFQDVKDALYQISREFEKLIADTHDGKSDMFVLTCFDMGYGSHVNIPEEVVQSRNDILYIQEADMARVYHANPPFSDGQRALLHTQRFAIRRVYVQLGD